MTWEERESDVRCVHTRKFRVRNSHGRKKIARKDRDRRSERDREVDTRSQNDTITSHFVAEKKSSRKNKEQVTDSKNSSEEWKSGGRVARKCRIRVQK